MLSLYHSNLTSNRPLSLTSRVYVPVCKTLIPIGEGLTITSISVEFGEAHPFWSIILTVKNQRS